MTSYNLIESDVNIRLDSHNVNLLCDSITNMLDKKHKDHVDRGGLRGTTRHEDYTASMFELIEVLGKLHDAAMLQHSDVVQSPFFFTYCGVGMQKEWCTKSQCCRWKLFGSNVGRKFTMTYSELHYAFCAIENDVYAGFSFTDDNEVGEVVPFK